MNQEPDSEAFDLLVADCVERLATEGLDALDRLCNENPECAGQLREVAQQLLQAGIVALPDAEPGVSIGDYLIRGELGRGGVGIVYEAEDPRLRRRVALKMLRAESKALSETDWTAPRPSEPHGSKTLAMRFVDEARISGQLEHPGIVPVYDVGVSGDRLYFAMKIVRGQALSALLAARKNSADERLDFLRIFSDVCQAMAFAHRQNVIHRDLKPANIMVGAFGEVQIVDWGMAKVASDPSATTKEASPVRGDAVTAAESLAGSILGTPSYMAPEQAAGDHDRVGPSADVFSLGALLYELLTCTRLRDGSGAVEQRLAEALEPVPAPALAALDAVEVPPELGGLCRACLQFARQDRPADAAAVRDRITGYLLGLEQRAEKARLDAARAEVELYAQRRARKLTLTIATLVVLLIAVVAGSWALAESAASRRRQSADAKTLADLADAGTALQENDWSAALAAFDRAFARSEHATPALRERVDRERRAARARAEVVRENARLAASNRGLLEDLADIRQPEGFSYYEMDWLEVGTAYESRFRREGIDPFTEGLGRASEILHQRGLQALGIAGSLDEWADAETRAGNADRARLLFDLAATLESDDEARGQLRKAGRNDDLGTLQRLVDALELERAERATLLLAARSLQRLNDSPRARRMLETAVRRFPDDFGVAIALARHLGAGPATADRAAAVGFYRAAIALRPRAIEPLHELGVLLIDLGLLEEAATTFRQATSQVPDDPHLLYHLALLYRETDPSEAMQLLRRALEVDPTSVAPRLALVEQHLIAGEGSRALELMNELDADAAAGFDDHIAYMRGRTLIAVGDTERGMAALQRAVAAARARSSSVQPSALTSLGRAFLQQGAYDDAVRVLHRANALDPSPIRTRNLAAAQEKAGRITEAIDNFRVTLRQLPSDRLAATRLAWLLLQAQDWPAAEKAYEQLLHHHPTRWSLYRNLAVAQDRAGDLAAAKATLRRRIDDGPDDSGDSNYRLGNLHLRSRPPSLTEAEAAFREAVHARPEFAEAWCDLGRTLRFAGRYAESLDCYRTGHRFGSARATWNEPSAQWVAAAESLAATEPKLLEILDDGGTPADSAEARDAASFAYRRGRFGRAADLAQQAIDGWHDPGDLPLALIASAAGAACLAAAQAVDTGPRDLRFEQLGGLLELFLEGALRTGASDPAATAAALRAALSAADLDSVFGDGHLEQLDRRWRIRFRELRGRFENAADALGDD